MAAKKKGKLGGGGAPKPEQDLLYSAQQIWQAGLGALARAQAGAPKIFDELMREGGKLQGGALDAAQQAVMQAFRGAQKTVNRRVDTVQGASRRNLGQPREDLPDARSARDAPARHAVRGGNSRVEAPGRRARRARGPDQPNGWRETIVSSRSAPVEIIVIGTPQADSSRAR